jgi:hypothetical protein
MNSLEGGQGIKKGYYCRTIFFQEILFYCRYCRAELNWKGQKRLDVSGNIWFENRKEKVDVF